MGAGAGSRHDRVLTTVGNTRGPGAARQTPRVSANSPATPVPTTIAASAATSVRRDQRGVALRPHHRQARHRPQQYHAEREPGQAEDTDPADRGRSGEPAVREQDVALRPYTRSWRGSADASRPSLHGGRLGTGPMADQRGRNRHWAAAGDRCTTGPPAEARPQTPSLPTTGSGTDPAPAIENPIIRADGTEYARFPSRHKLWYQLSPKRPPVLDGLTPTANGPVQLAASLVSEMSSTLFAARRRWPRRCLHRQPDRTRFRPPLPGRRDFFRFSAAAFALASAGLGSRTCLAPARRDMPKGCSAKERSAFSS